MYWIGTSGYNYPEWRGSFYPEGWAARRMLSYYGERFRTVEINYTFYRLPTSKVLSGWAAETPDPFLFTLKASRRLTHIKKLRDCGAEVETFCRLAGELGPKLGALLFQLPPAFKKDLGVLEAFLAQVPRGARAAFEFRHPSWHDAEVNSCLSAHGAALCVADSDRMSTPLAVTAPFAYFRLRDEGYRDDDLVEWAAKIRETTSRCDAVFVYFKHEEQGIGPAFAARLHDLLSGESVRAPQR